MKGSNEFSLNEATMIEIVQQWIDRTMVEPRSDVVHVREVNGEFKIGLKEREKS